MSPRVSAAVTACWEALASRPEVRYRLTDYPDFTFLVRGLTESGRVIVFQPNGLTTYMDLEMLAKSLEHGTVVEVR